MNFLNLNVFLTDNFTISVKILSDQSVFFFNHDGNFSILKNSTEVFENFVITKCLNIFATFEEILHLPAVISIQIEKFGIQILGLWIFDFCLFSFALFWSYRNSSNKNLGKNL